MGDVTLYHWEPNANSGKPMLALMEKDVAFHSHYIDLLNFDQHKPEYLAINPQGTIPAPPARASLFAAAGGCDERRRGGTGSGGRRRADEDKALGVK